MKSSMIIVSLFVLLSTQLVWAQEYKPLEELSELEWLVGEYRGEGVVLDPETPGGKPGPAVDSTLVWEKMGEHFLVHRGEFLLDGKKHLNATIHIGIDSKTKQAECWGFLRNGIRAVGTVLRSGNKLKFHFEGRDSAGRKPKATISLERDSDSEGYTVRYTSIVLGGEELPVPPTIKAIRKKR